MTRRKIDLQHFPPDLVYLICETFCQHCTHPNVVTYWTSDYQWKPETIFNRETLLKLSLLCKSWGHIAQKVLYHHFGTSETTLIAEILFCRTVSQNPGLAKLVKYARLRHIDTTDNPSPIEDWIVEPLNKFSEFLNFPGTTFDSEASNWESFVAPLILLQVPNLKYLHVGHKGDCLIFDKFDKPAVVRQQALPLYIDSFMAGYDQALNGTLSEIPGHLDVSQEGLGGLFPALKRLKFLGICSPNINTVRDPFQLQSVTRLDCQRFALRKDQLRKFISPIAALELFNYHACGNGRETFATGQDICEVLAPHKDTLRIMSICTYYAEGSFMPIRQLENLQSISFTPEAFWNPMNKPILDEQALVSALPPSLKHVTVSPIGWQTAYSAAF
ncbi:Ff.00g119230.m01.CDS01 [Fusarium sp. VM40]|nr:Ff.00g119230.m01.CDS01 [Fusarium sp. VM40]